MVINLLRSIFSPSNLKSKVFFRFNGQIDERSEIGRWIRMLSSLEENCSIVEIGTWNGRGSSRMIAMGVKQKLDLNPQLIGSCNVTGFEIHKTMFRKSERFLARYGFFNLVYGSIVRPEELDNHNLTSEEELWLQQDIQRMSLAPFVEEMLPPSIDLLILDGGEFSTYAEFEKLEHRSVRWIVLDDTKTRKCKQILENMKLNSHYTVVSESFERNGTAVIRVNS